MKIVGHRGARRLAPENTVAALKKGLQHHVDELEFDLRITKDNVVILHHDFLTFDPDGTEMMISHHTYKELKQHNPDLATFEEALEAIKQRASMYIEVKPGVNIKPIVKIIEAYLAKGWPKELFKLGSFGFKTLLELHAALPELDIIVVDNWSGVRATRRARQIGTRYISLNQLFLWGGFISGISRRGYKLYTFALNDPAKARRWAKRGLYAVVTDYPDRFERH